MTLNEGVFPDISYDEWRIKAEKGLKEKAFEESLVTQTLDNLTLHPLYERREESAIMRPHGAMPWTIMQKVDHVDPVTANKQALIDLENGATGLALVFRDAASAYGYGLEASDETFDQALENIDLTAITLHLEPGPRGKKTQELFANYCKRKGYNPSSLNVQFGLDALGAVSFCGTMRWPFEDIQAHMRNEWQNRLDDGFTGPFYVCDGRPFHNAGATVSDELAIVLANGLSYLRALTAKGADTALAEKALSFTLSADCDELITLSKFRAMRLLWAHIQEACSLSLTPIKLHAETSFRMLSKQDPNTNYLRLTMACFSAAIGGADTITVSPPSAASGLSNAFGRRMSRNIQLLLQKEAHSSKVIDPAAGSGAFEAITDALCEEAWVKFQEIEKSGGLFTALTSGQIHKQIDKANNARKEAISKGEKTVLGVSLHSYDGMKDQTIESVEPYPELVITKGALTIPALRPLRDEEIYQQLGEKV